MSLAENYLSINKQSWNNKTAAHVQSEFYGLDNFLAGQTSLKEIELGMLGDIAGKSILHLQCHFGQDSISLARMGAQVTGVDLSDKAIAQANDLAQQTGVNASFICCDVYDLPNHLDEQFDIVFTTYGTIGWLPDMDKWAKTIATFLKPGGELVFVEFHPVVWMFDTDFVNIAYNYFNTEPIIETETGTYADRQASITQQTICWNHSMSEVVNSLVQQGLQISSLDEYNYSPYNCFKNMIETAPGRYQLAHIGDKLPMIYAVRAVK